MSQTRGLFVVGTDTNVGKTAVGSAIVRHLFDSGTSVGAYKPAVSGAIETPDGPAWEDVIAYETALQQTFPSQRICPQRFLAPLAPPIAARAEGKSVDPQKLRTGSKWWDGKVDLFVIEGAGGLLSPISDSDLVADLAVDLGYPVVVVGRLGLGTINHSLLTIEAARARQLEIAGVILCQSVPERGFDPSCETNREEIERWGRVSVLAVLPYVPGADLLKAGELQRIDWRLLARPPSPPQHTIRN